MRLAITVTLILSVSAPASARNLAQYLSTKWTQQKQAFRVRFAQNAKKRWVRSQRAGRQSFHRAQGRKFKKDFNAWAKDARIAAIHNAKKNAFDLPNLRRTYGIGTGLSTTTAALALTSLATGGNPTGLILATAFIMQSTPDGNKITSKAQAARLATIIHAGAEGYRIPRSLLPVYNRDLRIARMQVNRQIRSLSQQLKGYEGAMREAKPQLGNLRILSAEQAGQIGVERAQARMRAAH